MIDQCDGEDAVMGLVWNQRDQFVDRGITKREYFAAKAMHGAFGIGALIWSGAKNFLPWLP